MKLTIEQFKQAHELCDYIIDNDVEPLRLLDNAIFAIKEPQVQLEFIQHINALFLNILVNELYTRNSHAESRAIAARKANVEIVKKIRETY